MSGCRPLNQDEYELVKDQFTKTRDHCLFVLGTRSGFRITSLLSLKIKDVLNQNRVKIKRCNMKGKVASHEIVLHEEAKQSINDYLNTLDTIDPEAPLFQSETHNGAISRQSAHKILKKAFNDAKLEGCLATHTMRKTLAKRIYERSNHDLIKVKEVLGHSSIVTTIEYLSPNQDEIDRIILE